MESLILGVIFVAAGRADLPWCWGAMAIHAICVGIMFWSMDPDLRQERMKPAGTEHDRHLRVAMIPLLLLHLVLVGLDLRFGWSGELPFAVHAAGVTVMTASLLFGAWAVRTNRFFSSVVRIQADRGHEVVTGGPYRFIRHPGYLGVLGCAIGGAVAFGSWWSLVPLAPLVLVVAARALSEERLLMQSLPGYAEYAQGVRCRLLPGVW